MGKMLLSLVVFFLFATFGLSVTDPSSNPYTCSSSQPCKIGCCSNSGYCGFGPSFCGSGNCTSNCDRKSDCDPGWGAQWSTAESCPLNVCCSQYGFCGTTQEFCGDKTVKRPSTSGTSASGRTIGYYEAWSPGRNCDGRVPEDLLAGAYTHLNFAFAYIDPSSFAVAPMAATDVPLYTRFTALKQYNPGLQTWISIGGWSFNDPGPTQSTFSNLAGSSAAQSKFFASLLTFMGTYGFDGVDIDWEYPVAPERGGTPADYANYVSFLRNLKSALTSGGHNYGLTITTPSSYWYLQHFDIVSMSGIIDWFNVMTYDLHGTWDSTDPYIGPYVNAHTNLTEIQQTFDLFWRNNIDPSKIVMGLGFYGRSFTLANAACTAPGCAFSSGGTPGDCTGESGTLSYGEINRKIAAGATKKLDTAAAVQIVSWADQWVSFDDPTTFKMKMDYANSLGLSGTLVWAASLDDNNNTAALALSSSTGRFAKSLAKIGPTPDPLTACRWGDCDGSCPAGLSAAQQGGSGKHNTGIKSGCADGTSRSYCCPSNDMPTCRWTGGGLNCGATSKGRCTSTEVEVATDTTGCPFGHKRLCCSRKSSDALIGNCIWRGTAPFCAVGLGHAGCNSGETEIAYDTYGAGGEQPCGRLFGYKSLCCVSPYPQNCIWEYGRSFLHPFTCNGMCTNGKYPIAADYGQCSTGAGYLCCNNPASSTIPTNFNVCYTQDGDFIESGEQDTDDTDTSDILELYWYETECFSPAPAQDGSSSADQLANTLKRRTITSDSEQYYVLDSGLSSWELPELCDEDDNCQRLSYDDPLLHDALRHFTNHSHVELEPRGRNRFMKICDTSKNQIGTLRTSSYPAAGSLSRNLYTLASQGVCMSVSVAHTLAAGAKVVVEHVLELQTVKQYEESVISNKLPSGATYGALKFNPVTMFRDNGYLSMTWSQLGIAQPAGTTGNTPIQAIANAMGSLSDIRNLQRAGAKENGVKTAMWGLFKNINGDKKWNIMTPAKRINALDTILWVFQYLNDPTVNDSLQYSFTLIRTILAAVDGSSAIPFASSGAGLAAVWVLYLGDFFNVFESNSQNYVGNRITQELSNFWQNSGNAGAAAVGYSAPFITYVVNNMQTRQANRGSDMTVARKWLTN